MPDAATILIIAGCNGSGKTTLARQLMEKYSDEFVFLNADEIQREHPDYASPVASGKIFLHRLKRITLMKRSVMIETTLASQMYVAYILKWRKNGYQVILHFIELPSADYAVQRVAERVNAGGHPVPEQDIRRRYGRGIEMFHTIYKPLVNEWHHWFTDQSGLRRYDCSK